MKHQKSSRVDPTWPFGLAIEGGWQYRDPPAEEDMGSVYLEEEAQHVHPKRLLWRHGWYPNWHMEWVTTLPHQGKTPAEATELVERIRRALSVQAGSGLAERLTALEQKVEKIADMLQVRPLTKTLAVYDLGDSRYRLKSPLTIAVEEYDDGASAYWPETEIYGEGETEAVAISQLKGNIVRFLEELKAAKSEELGRLPREWLRTLSALIEG